MTVQISPVTQEVFPVSQHSDDEAPGFSAAQIALARQEFGWDTYGTVAADAGAQLEQSAAHMEVARILRSSAGVLPPRTEEAARAHRLANLLDAAGIEGETAPVVTDAHLQAAYALIEQLRSDAGPVLEAPDEIDWDKPMPPRDPRVPRPYQSLERFGAEQPTDDYVKAVQKTWTERQLFGGADMAADLAIIEAHMRAQGIAIPTAVQR